MRGERRSKRDRPYNKNNGQWIARNIILGFFEAPIEALPETSVTDVVSYLLPSIGSHAYMHCIVLHARARNVHGPVRILPSRKQLLRTDYLRFHSRVSGLEMGVLLAEYLPRRRICLPLLFHGGDQLRPGQAANSVNVNKVGYRRQDFFRRQL